MDRLMQQLQENYLTGHAQNVTPAIYANLEALWPYFEANYQFILDLPRNTRILEIGSGSGSFIAWLSKNGFSHIRGLDISQQEVDRANARGVPLICADAHDYLAAQPAGSVDLVIAKALFEHMTKQDGADFVAASSRVLSEHGKMVLDVPNMDWIASNHERYMDLTHHIGYTRESMSQMLLLYFRTVEVKGTREAITSRGSSIRIKIVKPIAVKITRAFLRLLGEGAANVLFESRGIIAVATR